MERAEIINNFKIRASGAHSIMGVKGLGKTGETYLKQWLKEKLYNRREDIKSKYLSKGNQCEEDGFTLMATELNLGMVYKNIAKFENDFCTGVPDLILDKVYDDKNSWSLSTFPIFETEIPNNDYWWQGQVYMYLTGIKKYVLAYTLIDAPADLVAQAVKWMTDPEEIYKAISNMIYTEADFKQLCKEFCPLAESDYFIEIPECDRIKTFEFDYDEEAIKKLEGRVLECRIFLNNLIK